MITRNGGQQNGRLSRTGRRFRHVHGGERSGTARTDCATRSRCRRTPRAPAPSAASHRYRVGSNYQRLPVNAPIVPVHIYSKDEPESAF
jgi:hypothetical protein